MICFIEELSQVLNSDVHWDTRSITISNYPSFFYQSLGEKDGVLYLLYGNPTDEVSLAVSHITKITKSPSTQKVHIVKLNKAKNSQGALLVTEEQLKSLGKINEHLWRIEYPFYLYEREGNYRLYQVESSIKALVPSQNGHYGYIKGNYLYEEYCDGGGCSSRRWEGIPSITTSAQEQLSSLQFIKLSDSFYQRGIRLIYLNNLQEIHFVSPVYLPFEVSVSEMTKKTIIWGLKDYRIKISLSQPLGLEIL